MLKFNPAPPIEYNVEKYFLPKVQEFGSSFSLPDYVAKNYPPPKITVYEFIASPDYNKPRFVWCREGRVIAAGPRREDVEWAFALDHESRVQVENGRTLVRPFDVKLDVIDKRMY